APRPESARGRAARRRPCALVDGGRSDRPDPRILARPGALTCERVLVRSLRDPRADRGRDFLLRFSADVDADMPAAERELPIIVGADVLFERERRLRRHQMILLRVYVQDRHGHLLQIHTSSTDREMSLD